MKLLKKYLAKNVLLKNKKRGTIHNMDEKEKVLFIIPYLVGGGALKTVANLSKKITEKYDVKIVGIYKSEKKFDFFGDLIELNMTYTKNPIKKLIDFFKVRSVVKKIKTDNKFAFSISFLVIADMINVFSRSKNKEKTIVSIRNNESVEYKNKLFRKLQVKLSTKLADFIVSISEEVKYDLIENFNVKESKIKTIYNPCSVKFTEKKLKGEYFDKKNTLITVGGLKKQKGQWHLIRAMSKVTKYESNVKLLILGRGNYEKYLKKLVYDLNLSNNISFVGYVMNPYDYIRKSDVFVFPSLYEGLGNALMEALMCGIPIIASDYSCGAREILAPNTNFNEKTFDKADYAEFGVLTPVCDGIKYTTEKLTSEEEILADTILDFLKNKKIIEEYKIKSLKRANDFEISNIVNQWYDLFNKIKKEEKNEKN